MIAPLFSGTLLITPSSGAPTVDIDVEVNPVTTIAPTPSTTQRPDKWIGMEDICWFW